MKFTAVVTSHANERGLRNMLGILRYQTRKPDEILVFMSGYDDETENTIEREFGVDVIPVLDHGDWGHEKRAGGVAEAKGDWLGFFNDDDEYEPHYLARMMAVAEEGESEAVFCGWNQPNCVFEMGSSTSGNFIVNTSFARKVGYTSRRYEADGDFIAALTENGARVSRVDEVLYRHNAGPQRKEGNG